MHVFRYCESKKVLPWRSKSLTEYKKYVLLYALASKRNPVQYWQFFQRIDRFPLVQY